jgi:hypothetical protein
MAKKKSSSSDDALAYTPSPRIHFFYERDGTRAVSPRRLIDDGDELWLDQLRSIPKKHLRPLLHQIDELLSNRPKGALSGGIEGIRGDVVLGTITPKGWDASEPYPYKGMLISALYFREAARLNDAGEDQRVWHLLTMAYYHLGIASTLTAKQIAAKAPEREHARRSLELRLWVLEALKRIEASSIDAAIGEVISLFGRAKSSKFEELAQNLFPKKNEDPLETLRDTLKDWSAPSGPYPEICSAFARFNARSERASVAGLPPEEHEEPDEDDDFYLRLVSHRLHEGEYFRETFNISRATTDDDDLPILSP